MLGRLVGGLAGMVLALVLVLGMSPVWAQSEAPSQAVDLPPSPPWMFPAEPAMLEYVLKPGTESCRDEEHFRLELAIHRDHRRECYSSIHGTRIVNVRGGTSLCCEMDHIAQ